MGRFNHENTVAIPGFDELVALSGDDTFQTNPPASSQLYMYTASDTDELWADEGTLHAFVADGTDNDYFDLQPGETISGEFVPVPENIAKGKACRRPRADASGRLPELPGARAARRRCRRTGRSGSSTSGATRRTRRAWKGTTSSTSSASRTSRTTSGRGCRTSSTSPIPGGRRQRAQLGGPVDEVDERADLQDGARRER